MRRIPKHYWRPLDATSNLEVRQVTGRLRKNKWEVRNWNEPDNIITLTDEEFARFREDRLRLMWNQSD